MPRYISSLDDTYIRFDAAAEILAKINGMSTPHSMLETLTIAMWQGAFNPPDPGTDPSFDQSTREDPENWLSIPIEQPRVLLSEGQRALSPKPFEYYEAGRDTIISVMYCDEMLPGEHQGWYDLLEGGDGLHYLHGKTEALEALIRIPLHHYSDDAKAFLRSIYIPRRLLQAWLDFRSLAYRGIFVPESRDAEIVPSKPANDESAGNSNCKRGRPRLAAWDDIEMLAVKLNAQQPSMPRKELAGHLFCYATERHDPSEVPSETTILRKLARLLGG